MTLHIEGEVPLQATYSVNKRLSSHPDQKHGRPKNMASVVRLDLQLLIHLWEGEGGEGEVGEGESDKGMRTGGEVMVGEG